MSDRVILVTGGATGIGYAIAQQLGKTGATVALASRSAERLAVAAERLAADGIVSEPYVMDVRDHGQVESVVEGVIERFGRLDGLVNNAAGNFVAPAERISTNGWRAVIDIVLNGTWNCTSAVGKWWIANDRAGSVLNIVATYAWTGHPGTVHSAAAKGGVVAMARTLAVEWAPYNIRVNCLAPGATETEGAGAALWSDTDQYEKVRASVPAGRFATPDEIGGIAEFLLSDRAAYITGEVLTADGGQWLGKQIYGHAPPPSGPSPSA